MYPLVSSCSHVFIALYSLDVQWSLFILTDPLPHTVVEFSCSLFMYLYDTYRSIASHSCGVLLFIVFIWYLQIHCFTQLWSSLVHCVYMILTDPLLHTVVEFSCSLCMCLYDTYRSIASHSCGVLLFTCVCVYMILTDPLLHTTVEFSCSLCMCLHDTYRSIASYSLDVQCSLFMYLHDTHRSIASHNCGVLLFTCIYMILTDPLLHTTVEFSFSLCLYDTYRSIASHSCGVLLFIVYVFIWYLQIHCFTQLWSSLVHCVCVYMILTDPLLHTTVEFSCSLCMCLYDTYRSIASHSCGVLLFIVFTWYSQIHCLTQLWSSLVHCVYMILTDPLLHTVVEFSCSLCLYDTYRSVASHNCGVLLFIILMNFPYFL